MLLFNNNRDQDKNSERFNKNFTQTREETKTEVMMMIMIMMIALLRTQQPKQERRAQQEHHHTTLPRTILSDLEKKQAQKDKPMQSTISPSFVTLPRW